MIIASRTQFHVERPWGQRPFSPCLNSVLNVKAVVAAFNQEKALEGAFSVITNLRMELFQALLFCVPAGVKFRRQHWLFLLICLLVFVIILSIYLPIASRVDDIEVSSEHHTLDISTLLSWTDRRSQVS